MLVFVRYAKERITDLKISPDGKILASGSYDGAIYIHELPSLKILLRPFRKHAGGITHLDFS